MEMRRLKKEIDAVDSQVKVNDTQVKTNESQKLLNEAATVTEATKQQQNTATAVQALANAKKAQADTIKAGADTQRATAETAHLRTTLPSTFAKSQAEIKEAEVREKNAGWNNKANDYDNIMKRIYEAIGGFGSALGVFRKAGSARWENSTPAKPPINPRAFEEAGSKGIPMP